MKTRRDIHGIIWIDLENPTRQEVLEVAAEYALDAYTAEELLMPSLRPRVEMNAHYAYLVLHFPALHHTHTNREQEIDFVVGRDFLVTAHYEAIDPLHKFAKVIEVTSVLEDGATIAHAGQIFAALLKKFYKSVEHEVENVRRQLSTIEEHVFSNHQVEMVAAISRAARDLLNMRQIIEPHRDVLKTLDAETPAFFGVDFKPHLRAVENEYYRVHNHIMRSTESLHELRETNNSLLTTRQNETMRVLAIASIMLLPLSLIAEIFAMDTKHMPIIGTSHDFLIVLSAMAVVLVSIYIYFKKKKWL